MAIEIEAKFLNIDHDAIRVKLLAVGATMEQSMRSMRRQLFDYPDSRLQAAHSRLRVRDEGGKITLTVKKGRDGNYAEEYETTVGSYETTAKIIEAVGLRAYTSQHTKREAWHLNDVEVVLDIWPWLNPYIEIEGPTEDDIKAAALTLGLAWDDAVFGSVDVAYMAQYTAMTSSDTVGEITNLSFEGPMPQWLCDRL